MLLYKTRNSRGRHHWSGIAGMAQNAIERLFDTLVDPKRCDRAMLLILIGYAAIWTFYCGIARSSQDLHPDMTELIAWSRTLSFGYLKHPPLAAWIVRVWFDLIPMSDWSFYLLAMLMPTIALWISWQLSAEYLDIDKRVLGVALLMFIPFYNFHALKFNPNTVLMPTWAVTTFWFLRSYRTQSSFYGVLTGIGAGACMLGKYWSVFLLFGLFLAALVDPRRGIYFRSSAPWITLVVGLALFGPNLVWLFQHNFAPFEYATAKHVSRTLADTALEAGAYLVGSMAYAAAPIILVFLAARPDRGTIADMLWPRDRERRLVAIVFWTPLLLPCGAALIGGINLTSLWSMSAWTLLPIVLLSPSNVRISPLNLRRILSVAVALPLVMVIVAPAIAIAIHLYGVTPPFADSRLLAAETERVWHELTPQPLKFIGGNIANEVIAYAADQPRPLPLRFFGGSIGDQVYADWRGWPSTSPLQSSAGNEEQVQSGMALVCSEDSPNWLQAAAARAAQDPASRRIEVEVRRDFLGISGRPHRYVIFIIPPHP
jgi:Dolichyl-phosphate-mannose-protein mannosyltransferase